MEGNLHGSHNGSRDGDSQSSGNRVKRLNSDEKESLATVYVNSHQDITKSSENTYPMTWLHTLMDPNDPQSRYILDISGEKAHLETMATGSIVRLPQSYSVNPKGNLYGVVVGPNAVLSIDSMQLYNFDSFGKVDPGTIANDQNELNESISNLVKGEEGVACAGGVSNVETDYINRPSSSPVISQDQKDASFCVICQKYVKNSEELQRHIFMDHPEQASISFLGDSSNIATALPMCPSCKIELRKINVYDQEYQIHGEQDDEQSMNLIQASGIFMACDQCGKEFTLGLAPDPSIQIPSTEPAKRHFCEHCEKNYKHNRDLRKHLRTHHGFVDSASQTSYQSNTINGNNTEVSASTTNPEPQPQSHKMVCQICKKNFRGPFELRRHILTVHENKRPYKCSHCCKVFRDAYELKRHSVSHQRIHFQNMAASRMLPESIASTDILRPQNMEGHASGIGASTMCQSMAPGIARDVYDGQPGTNYHSQNINVDNFCGACEKNFRGSNEFKRHCTVVHEKKYRYRCFHCGKLWRDQYDLKRHCRRSHFIDQEIDRAYIRQCLIEHPSHTTNISSSSNQLPVSSIASFELSQHMSLTLNHDAAAAIFGIASDRNMRTGGNNLENSYAIDHDHICKVLLIKAMARGSPNHSIFQNLPTMQSATMMYNTQADSSSNIMENIHQPQDSEDINEESKNAVNWSNFESDLQVKKTDYS